ncbi:MAG: putative glycoside hydrolase [Minisyncoccota bacterium]
MKKISKHKISIFIILFVCFIFFIFFVIPDIFPDTYNSEAQALGATTTLKNKIKTEEPVVNVVTHIKTPESVKAIYMTQCVVGTPSFRKRLVDIVDTTEINSIIIDIKDFSGTIGFKTINPLLVPASMKGCGASDMKEFIEMLHEKNIYVIGRITVFQDPFYTKAHPEQAVQSKSSGSPWKDRKGLSFIDVSSKSYWDVVVALSQESYEIGFDELNYDYIRYPSDGNMADAVYVNPNKAEALETFFAYLYKQVKPIGVVTSADLFGMVTVASDDMGIGQVLERALPYFDYIAPMVYPSHFAKGFHGYADPNKDVYGVISYSMGEAIKRTEATTTRVAFIGAEPIASTSPRLYKKPFYRRTMLRPWLQDFSYGGIYGPAEVRDQIKASYDIGLTSWMLWSPSNKYTVGALEKN